MSSTNSFFYRNPALLDAKNKVLYHVKSDPVTSQNILMKISDREIALLMIYMDNNEANLIFSLLPEKKTKRIKEELEYNRKLEIKSKLYSEITKEFLSYFREDNKSKKYKTYIRPKKPN